MRRIETSTLADQDISVALLVHTYTADADRQLQVRCFADQVAGGAAYTLHCTLQRLGAGSFYRVVPARSENPGAATEVMLFTEQFPVKSTDVLRVYLTGAGGDLATPDIITEIWEDDSVLPETADRKLEIDANGYAAADLKLWLAVAPLALVAQRVVADLGAISSDATAADNLETMLDGTGGQTLTLGQLRLDSTAAGGAIDIDNNAGPAISATSSFGTAVAFAAGGNGHGFTASGLGTGDGAYFVGGANGNGMRLVGAGTGFDLLADIVGTLTGDITGGLIGNITGNLSGSVGSVTGNLGGNVLGTVASVVGNLGGNVVGTVASVVGNVGGDLAGSVLGNVNGTVASVVGNLGGNVVGTVASVVGNLGGNVAGNVLGNVAGNVLGSVASIAAGGIVAATFGAGAIDAAAVADGAIDAGAFAQTAADKVWDSAARTLTALGAGMITSATFAANALNAAALAADAVAEIQSGLATAANQTTILGRMGAWTGVGDDTILGGMRALAGNAATNPASLVAGLTYTALANSQQALALAIDGIVAGSGATAAEVWTYAERRLTSAARIAVAVSGNGSMRSIAELAKRAYLLYPPAGPDERRVTVDNYIIRIEEAWRHIVHEGGGFYSILVEVPLEPGVRQFDLPTDMREAKLKSVYLGYDPRAISTISRTSETVTVVTAAEHGLTTGVYVKIDGVTGTGGTDFDEDSVQVTVTNVTTFTYTQDGIADDTGSGGEVQCYSSAVWLSYTDAYDLQPAPEWDVTATQPSQYYFPDPMTFAIDGVSDGYYPCAYLEYDAEAPEGDITGDLPGPAWLEDALISYAAWRQGAFKDGGVLFAEAVTRWKVSRASRQPLSND